MIINDYVLTELNYQRRSQITDHITALRAADDRHRPRAKLFRRHTRTAPSPRQVAVAPAR